MRVKTVVDEDFTNYKKPAMFIGTISCGGKCCIEAGIPLSVCQNDGWRSCAPITIDDNELCHRYLTNPLTKAVVFGGLEPMEQFEELLTFLDLFRDTYDCEDDVVIYTGYYPEEIPDQLHTLVFDEMSRKLKEFNKLSYKEKHGDPIELTKLKIRAEEIEKEIATLIDKIVSASAATMEYINERIDALDEEKKTVKEKIAQMSAEMYDRQNIGVISDYMSKWNDISIDDKLTVVDTLIESIHVGHGKVKIAWKI